MPAISTAIDQTQYGRVATYKSLAAPVWSIGLPEAANARQRSTSGQCIENGPMRGAKYPSHHHEGQARCSKPKQFTNALQSAFQSFSGAFREGAFTEGDVQACKHGDPQQDDMDHACRH